jgi:hypothetical protein
MFHVIYALSFWFDELYSRTVLLLYARDLFSTPFLSTSEIFNRVRCC